LTWSKNAKRTSLQQTLVCGREKLVIINSTMEIQHMVEKVQKGNNTSEIPKSQSRLKETEDQKETSQSSFKKNSHGGSNVITLNNV